MVVKLIIAAFLTTAMGLREETSIRTEIGTHADGQVNDTNSRASTQSLSMGYGGSAPPRDDRQRIEACQQNIETEVQYPKRSSDGKYDEQSLWPAFGGSVYGNTVNYQRFVDVVAQLKEVPQWQRDNVIVRGNDLGMCALYEQLWRVPDGAAIKRPSPRFKYRTIYLGSSVDVHEQVRPTLDRVLGAQLGEALAPWTYAEIYQDTKAFFDRSYLINTHKGQDVAQFMTKLLHKVHLGIAYDDPFWTRFTPEAFTNLQNTFLMHAVLAGQPLAGPISTSVVVTGAFDSTIVAQRVALVKEYMTFINQDKRTGKDGQPLFDADLTNPSLGEDEWKEGSYLYNVASAFFDSLVFAGGLSVVQGIESAMALLNSDDPRFPVEDRAKNLQENDVEAFVYELYRLIPQVVGFPWWDPEAGYTGNLLHGIGSAGTGKTAQFDYGQRTIMQMATALRDPEAWGEDAYEFKIRDLDQQMNLNNDQIGASVKEWAKKQNEYFEANDKTKRIGELSIDGLDLSLRGAYGLAWVEQTNEYPKNDGVPGPMSRGCPGQALSIAITKAWLTTYIEQNHGPRHRWETVGFINEDGTLHEGPLKMVDTAPFHMQSVVIQSTWEDKMVVRQKDWNKDSMILEGEHVVKMAPLSHKKGWRFQFLIDGQQGECRQWHIVQKDTLGTDPKCDGFVYVIYSKEATTAIGDSSIHGKADWIDPNCILVQKVIPWGMWKGKPQENPIQFCPTDDVQDKEGFRNRWFNIFLRSISLFHSGCACTPAKVMLGWHCVCPGMGNTPR